MRPRLRTLPAPLLLLAVLLALVTAVLTPASALAATKTWIGAGNTILWSDGANWVGGVAPVQFDDLVFPIVAGHLTNTNDFPPGTVFNSITLQGFNYVLNGNAVTIANGQSITANYASGSTSTINLDVSGSGELINVVNTGATLVFGGSLNTSFQKSGTGTAVLLAPGAPGGWINGAGILNIQNGAALGGIDGTVGAIATLQVQGGIALPGNIFLAGGTVESVSGNNTLTGGITLNGNSTISADTGATLTLSTNPVSEVGGPRTLTANIAGTATIASPLQNNGGLTKTGTGLLTLSGTNPYTGPTVVNAGTLLVNGSQPASTVTVASGATLGGTGTTGPVTANGVVSPGVGGPGVLHTGNAAFNGGSTFAVDLNGTTVGSGYDQLFTAGPVTLTGPTLAVSVGFPSAPGNAFAIIQSTGAISGGFSGLPEGFTFTSGGRTFRINYTPNAVTLTDVTPIPTSTPTPTPTPNACILGDINCDGIVDIRDYGIWRQQFGQQGAGLPADLNQDGIVDIRDYGIWRANFGHTAGAAARAATPTAAPRVGSLPAGMVHAPPGNAALLQAEDGAPAVPIVPLVGGLLGLGGWPGGGDADRLGASSTSLPRAGPLRGYLRHHSSAAYQGRASRPLPNPAISHFR